MAPMRASPGIDLDAVRTDGALVRIRTATPADLAALTRLHEQASDRSRYLRFFAWGREPVRRHAAQLARLPCSECCVLVAEVAGRMVGVAEFERLNDTDAEIAMLVADAEQGTGIGTLLAEHLAGLARGFGYRRFVAEALAENTDMLNLLADLGLPMRRDHAGRTMRLTIELQLDAAATAASDRREALADAASLTAVLAPRSVVVIGAGSRVDGVGHQVLRNIIDGGYAGAVYAVNRQGRPILGVPAVASPADLPAAVDLAVIAVPAAEVPAVVRACGRRGVRGLVVLSSGFGEAGPAGRDLQRRVVDLARRSGMRLVGPNCLGLLNTDPRVRLNATFAALPVADGSLGLASQSGALGIAVAQAAGRCGVGVAQFVSVGNKADVSGNDLLMAWEHDPRVKVIALYLESFGNPRKFARIARRISAGKPIIAIKGGRTPAGERAGRSHTAAAASSNTVVDAMFEQAGVLRVDTMPDLLDAALVLATQPVPAGTRLAIVGNSGGPQILAADAAGAAGLDVVTLSDGTLRRLREAVPDAASWGNPADLGAAADEDRMGRAVAVLLSADEVDVVLTVFTETAVGDPAAVLARIDQMAGGAAKPVVATQVGEAPGVGRSDRGGTVPVFAFPEPAVRAIGVACRYARIRRAHPNAPRPPAGVDPVAARAIADAALAGGACWLSAEESAALLACYGVPVCAQQVVDDADQAAAAAAGWGYPVVAKAADGGLHKTDVGAVRVGIGDETALRVAVAQIRAAAPTSRLLVQPMVPAGTELIVGALQDAGFGPLVMVGAGGILSDLVADRAFALAPIDQPTAAAMVGRLRMAPLLDGYRGRAPASRAAVADLLTRISHLVDDVPQIAELDLNPVICQGDSLTVVDTRIRVAAPPTLPDPVLRHLAER